MNDHIEYKNGHYEGNVNCNGPFGSGTFYFCDGSKCEGMWRNKPARGYGIFTNTHDIEYLSEWYISSFSDEARILSDCPSDIETSLDQFNEYKKNKHNQLFEFPRTDLTERSNILLARAYAAGCYEAYRILTTRSEHGDGIATGYLGRVNHDVNLKQEYFCTSLKQGTLENRKYWITSVLDCDFNRAMPILYDYIRNSIPESKLIIYYLLKNYASEYDSWMRQENVAEKDQEEYCFHRYIYISDSASLNSIGEKYYVLEMFNEAIRWLYNSAKIGNSKACHLIKIHSKLDDNYLFHLIKIKQANGDYAESAKLSYNLYKRGDQRGLRLLQNCKPNNDSFYYLGLIDLEKNPEDISNMYTAAVNKYQKALDCFKNRAENGSMKNKIEYADILLINEHLFDAQDMYCSQKFQEYPNTIKHLTNFAENLKSNQKLNLGTIYNTIGIIFQFYEQKNLARKYYCMAVNHGYKSFSEESLNLFDSKIKLYSFLKNIPNKELYHERYHHIISKINWISLKEAYVIIGNLQRLRGFYDDAIKFYSIDELKTDAHANYLKACCLLKLNYYTAARDCLKFGSSMGSEECDKLLIEINRRIGTPKLKNYEMPAIVSSDLLHKDDERKRTKKQTGSF